MQKILQFLRLLLQFLDRASELLNEIDNFVRKIDPFPRLTLLVFEILKPILKRLGREPRQWDFDEPLYW